MKQVIVVNQALNLPTGKLAAQVAHAAIGAFLAATEDTQAAWIQAGMPKIVVYANDDAALLALQLAAQQRQIPVCLVRGEGRTVVPRGTITCIGVGPALATSIDPLTMSLPLVLDSGKAAYQITFSIHILIVERSPNNECTGQPRVSVYLSN